MTCTHRWVIPRPPAARGRCRLCGAERLFRADLDGSAAKMWRTQKKRAAVR